MGNRQVKFAYISFYTPFGKGYGCFAYNWVDIRSENACEVGLAFYSPFEEKRFDKKTGVFTTRVIISAASEKCNLLVQKYIFGLRFAQLVKSFTTLKAAEDAYHITCVGHS